MKEKTICLVCDLESDGHLYAVRYEAGERAPIGGVRFYLCTPHASALTSAATRPVSLADLVGEPTCGEIGWSGLTCTLPKDHDGDCIDESVQVAEIKREEIRQ